MEEEPVIYLNIKEIHSLRGKLIKTTKTNPRTRWIDQMKKYIQTRGKGWEEMQENRMGEQKLLEIFL